MQSNIVIKLKKYFAKRDDIIMAFLFGSRAMDRVRNDSDWDIAVYFKTAKKIDLESKDFFPEEDMIRSEVEKIVKSEIDFVLLNRARPSLVFSILNTGTVLSIKDHFTYLKLLSKAHYEAVDFWRFVDDFWRIRKQAASLTPEARALVIENLTFLENELSDLKLFHDISYELYVNDRSLRRNLERWIENLVMASLDIAKIILASDKKQTPQTYRETLKIFTAGYLEVSMMESFSNTVDMRNIVAHEYLDIRWERIQKFITEVPKLYPVFVEKIKKILENQ